MPSDKLVIDFETYDPLLKTYGSGWVFKYHYPEYEFEVLGCSILDVDDQEASYLDLTIQENKIKLFTLLKNYKELIMHNCLYDLGCLKVLYRDDFKVEDFIITDTLILTRVADQHMRFSGGYSLESICKKYKLAKKESSILHDYAWESGIYQEEYYKRVGRNCHTRPSEAMLEEFCKSDMRRFPVEYLAKYANKDTLATKDLYLLMWSKLSYMEDRSGLSDIAIVAFNMKLRGVRIDLQECKNVSKKLEEMAIETEKEILNQLNDPELININSGEQLGKALSKVGIIVPRTEKGNFSITSDWLESKEGGIFDLIRSYRKAIKLNRDTVKKLLDYQKAIPKNYRESSGKYGMLYPTLHVYGASLTGRDSSGGGKGCKEISIHQVPRRDEEFGPMCRALFVPFSGEKFCVADFSSQESRIQVHYAVQIGCTGADKIAEAWIKDPNMKYHQKVSDDTGLDYDTAKTINLGLSYNMTEYGLSNKLGLSVDSAKELLNQYYTMLPFMQELQTITSQTLKKNKYIKTLGGRRLNIDRPLWINGRIRTQERKALSKLAQGSAADQCKKAMIKAHKSGLKLVIVVHDELVVSSTNPDEDKNILQECMETAYTLKVPVVAEVGIGNNWNEGKV